MIAKLVKYYIVFLSDKSKHILNNMGTWNMIHITEKNKNFGNSSIQEAEMEYNVYKYLSDNEELLSKDGNNEQKDCSLDLCKQLKQKLEQVQKLESKLSEKERYFNETNWGNINWEKLSNIEKKGIYIRFFKTNIKKQIPYINNNQETISHIKSDENWNYYFEVGTSDFTIEERLEIIKINISQNALFEAEINEIEKNIEALKNVIHQLSVGSIKYIENKKNETGKYLKLLTAISKYSTPETDSNITIIEGWVSEKDSKVFEEKLEAEQLIYVKDELSQQDTPPILLKNNWFVSLFEPIVELFALPRYFELDLTPFLTPFFLLFFGLCIGDAGYGILMVISAFLLKYKMDKKFHFALKLLIFFGISTIVMGIVTGTFFGISLIGLDLFADIESIFLDSSNLFNFALVLGAIQILFAVFVRIINKWIQSGFFTSLSSLGWFIVLSTIVLIFIEDNDFQMSILYKILFSLGGALILFFNSAKMNILSSIGSGLWDVYMTVTGVFGDLLSYIRLFALSVASAMLGLVVNQIATEFGNIPYIGPVLFVLILLFGHGLNMMIALLGAFVHTMRLTFVEFYKNAGFVGGGVKFSPFKL